MGRYRGGSAHLVALGHGQVGDAVELGAALPLLSRGEQQDVRRVEHRAARAAAAGGVRRREGEEGAQVVGAHPRHVAAWVGGGLAVATWQRTLTLPLPLPLPLTLPLTVKRRGAEEDAHAGGRRRHELRLG